MRFDNREKCQLLEGQIAERDQKILDLQTELEETHERLREIEEIKTQLDKEINVKYSFAIHRNSRTFKCGLIGVLSFFFLLLLGCSPSPAMAQFLYILVYVVHIRHSWAEERLAL